MLFRSPCLDFSHLHARPGDGSMNTYDEWRRSLETYGQALESTALGNLHVHLSGIDYTPKGEKEHLPILESDFDLEALLKALDNFDCGGRIVCESPVMEDDALVIKEKWLIVSGEDTA